MALNPAYTNFTALAVGGNPVYPWTGTPSPSVRGGAPGGMVLWVSSNGDLQNGLLGDGYSADKPKSTLAGALALLNGRVNKGDVIYILPGHTESLAAADAMSATGAAAGFSIIGLGSGTQRPVFNWTAAASTWLFDTAGVELVNCILNFAVTAATVVVTPITVSANNCRIVNCYINWGASTTIGCGSTLGAISVTGKYFDFVGNFCNNLDVAGTTGQAITLISANGADYMSVRGNKIFGATTATTVGPIHFLTTLSSDVEIVGNYIENLIASSTIAVSSAISGTTGTVAFNQLRVNSGIQPITVSANMSTTLYQNFCSNTVNKNGALVVGAGTSA